MKEHLQTAWRAILLLTAVTLLGAVALGEEAPVAEAAEEGTLYACYEPSHGLVYRIKTEGTHSKCLSDTHVEFSWNETGDPGPEGPPGPPAFEGMVIVEANSARDMQQCKDASARCPSGYVVVGGGLDLWPPTPTPTWITRNQPSFNNVDYFWGAGGCMQDPPLGGWRVQARAMCVPGG